MILAVRKEEGQVPDGGFHYMLHPMAMTSEFEKHSFEMMGHITIEVPDEDGKELLEQARAALKHQVQVAILTENKLLKIKGEK